MLRELVSDLVGSGVSGAAACFTSRGDETTEVAGDVRLDDAFSIGSVTKTFVAAAALRLAADGVLQLDVPAKHWCDFVRSDVTVRMLMNHTSRVPEYMTAPGLLEAHLREPQRVWEPRDLVRAARGGREPRWRYSNTNYVLLGLILEDATALTLEEVLRALVLDPLDLRATTLPSSGTRLPDPSFAWAAGAMESTPSEVSRFLTALLRGELVDTADLRRTVEVVDDVEFDRYGAGIAVMSSILRLADSTCGAAWGHLGIGLQGSTAALATPDGTRCLVVCTRGALREAGWQILARRAWPIFCHEGAAT